jgi:hypothetical protein
MEHQMNAPYKVEAFLSDRAQQVQRRKPGFWVDVDAFDECDEPITLECRVNVDEERDSCGTGDSPTTYEVDIYEVVCNGVAMPDAEYTHHQKIVDAAIAEYKGY